MVGIVAISHVRPSCGFVATFQKLLTARLGYVIVVWKLCSARFFDLLRAQICMNTHVRTEPLCARACIRARTRAEGESKGHFEKFWGQGAQRTVNNRSKSTSGAPRLDDMRPRWTSAVFSNRISKQGGGSSRIRFQNLRRNF